MQTHSYTPDSPEIRANEIAFSWNKLQDIDKSRGIVRVGRAVVLKLPASASGELVIYTENLRRTVFTEARLTLKGEFKKVVVISETGIVKASGADECATLPCYPALQAILQAAREEGLLA